MGSFEIHCASIIRQYYMQGDCRIIGVELIHLRQKVSLSANEKNTEFDPGYWLTSERTES